MTSSSATVMFPDYILNGWRFQDLNPHSGQGEFKDWTLSALCSEFLKCRVAKHEQIQHNQSQCSTPSLISLTVGQTLKILESSPDPFADISSITRSIDSTALRHLLHDPRTPYTVFRQIDALLTADDNSASPVDIDEAILARERFLHTKDRQSFPDYMVTLSQLKSTLHAHYENGSVVIERKRPSRNGFQMLDAKRKDILRIQPTNEAFAKTFDRVTHGILQGLNWENIYVAGGMIFNTLLHVGDVNDEAKDIKECDIDLYLYGLSPAEANQKVEEIYQVWSSRNKAYCLSCGVSQQHTVVKTRRSINFIPEYPSRRLQIVLKLQPTPLDVLLSFDLDACALGFDGSRVLMLPRCARALETGYSVFTMDLVWGHHLAHRRESQEVRVFKYADRGFGLRILPSYVRTLDGESGSETLTGIADAVKNSVHKHFLESPDSSAPVSSVGLFDMDDPKMTDGQPNGRNGLGIFQTLLRHATIWHLDAAGLLRLDRSSLTGPTYDRWGSYDGLPTYDWGPTIHATMAMYQGDVEIYNNKLFDKLRLVICQKLGIDPQWGRYRNYLTRRIRHVIVETDLAAAQSRQITTPLIIPMELEVYIKDVLSADYGEMVKQALSSVLIPVHDSSKWDPQVMQMPPLHDTNDGSGNARYWLGTNTSMWSGQHWLLDEVAELLGYLYDWFLDSEHYLDESDTVKHGTDNSHCVWHVGKNLRRRFALTGGDSDEARLFQAWVQAGLPCK
ncbi:MAG: hypothetical protein Q9222_000773 [Ikaeria aurantiellina]